jgi:hypothetical protein
MRLGIISDTHDNVENVLKAVALFRKENVPLVVHCGDMISPKTATFFQGVALKFVRGNCDGDVTNLKMKLEQVGSEFLGERAVLEIEGKTIFVYHGHDKSKLDSFIKSGEYQYVFTGHTHILRDEQVGTTRVLNPGAHYYGCDGTVMVLDLGSGQVEVVRL